MVTNPSSFTLTTAQLAALLHSVPGGLGALSPLRNSPVTSATGLPVQITQKPLEWEPAARTLAAPKLALIVSAGTSESIVYVHGYGAPATHDHLVGCTPSAGGMFEVMPDLKTGTWSQVLWDGLALDSVPSTTDAVVPMSTKAWLACCGLVDAIKEARLEALASRTPYPAATASTSDVSLAVKTGLMTQDTRWFTGMVRRLLPGDPGELGDEEVREGLKELAKLGWILSAGEDEWSFSETMQPHAIEWSAAVVSGSFSLLLDDPDGLNRLHVGLIRTLSGIWTIECPPEGDLVKIGRTGGQALMLTMMKAVEKLLASWPADHAGLQPRTNAVFCASCGSAIPAGAHFCAGCGKPVQQPATPMCSKCGKPVHAGEKFCGSCGHRLS